MASKSSKKLPLCILLAGSSSLGLTTLAELLLAHNATTGASATTTIAADAEPRIFTIDESGQESEVTNNFFVADDDEVEAGTIRYREINSGEDTQPRLQILDATGFPRAESTSQKIVEDSYLKPLVELVSNRLIKFMEQSDIEYQMRSGKKAKIDRASIVDSRIHCCLYFTNPLQLTTEDITRMKSLSNVVNVIPVIGRADTLTSEELQEYKKHIRKELESNGVSYYGCAGQDTEFAEETDSADAEDSKKKHQAFLSEFGKLRTEIPFGIVASNENVTVDGKTSKGRVYPHGTLDIFNPQHCDTSLLLKLLEVGADELKTRTVNVIYKEFLKNKLAELKKI